MELSKVHQKLIKRLACGQFFSGQQLAAELDVSRTSIWNYLKKLEDVGFELHAVKGKGTRFASPLELLDVDRIMASIPTEKRDLLQQLDAPDVCTSTNHYLAQQNNLKPLPNGTVCITEMQTAGRGRLGRTWISPYGQNVYVSFLWRFKSGISALSGLSLACGVAGCDTLKDLGVKEHGLKWPNDILWQGKKLGGILVEIQGENQGEYTAIIGIGINYQMNSILSSSIDQPWVDVTGAYQGDIGRNELVGQLIGSVLTVLDSYEEKGFAPYVAKWNTYDCYNKKKVEISSGKETTRGVAEGVSKNGELKLTLENGSTQLIMSGEVSLRAGNN